MSPGTAERVPALTLKEWFPTRVGNATIPFGGQSREKLWNMENQAEQPALPPIPMRFSFRDLPVLVAVSREAFHTDRRSNLSMSPPVPPATMPHLCLNSCQWFHVTEFVPVLHPWRGHTRLFWLTHHWKCRSFHPGLNFLDHHFCCELV